MSAWSVPARPAAAGARPRSRRYRAVRGDQGSRLALPGRLRIEQADAHMWRSPEPVNYLCSDMWDKLGAADNAPQPAAEIGYWGMGADSAGPRSRHDHDPRCGPWH